MATERVMFGARGCPRQHSGRLVESARPLPPKEVDERMVDVTTAIEIARPRQEVATFSVDPDNAARWYENIEGVRWCSPRPLALGSRIAFVARFLGRRISYTYEVREHVPNQRLVMSTADGPFPMETVYAWSDTDAGTAMTLRNRGEPAGFGKIAAPIMARAMRRANTKDLRRLKALLENGPSVQTGEGSELPGP
jgi:hypothetical protein